MTAVGPVFFQNLEKVTALAAVQKLEGKGNIMGISMGSSEGAGYANAEGHLSTALKTLANRVATW